MLCAFAIEGDILAQLMWYLLHKTSHQVLRSFRRTPCLRPQPVPFLVQHSCLMSLISRFIRMDELWVVMAKLPDHSGAGSLLAVFRYPRYKAIVEYVAPRSPRWEPTTAWGWRKARRPRRRPTKAGRTTEAGRATEARRETRRGATSETWSSYTCCWTLQSNACTSACRPADTRTSSHSSGRSSCTRSAISESCGRVCGWRSIERAGNDV